MIRGNEHRSLSPNFEDLMELCDLYMGSSEGFRFEDSGVLGRFVLLTAFEQFPWQINPHHEVGRTHALMVGAASRHSAGLVDARLGERLFGYMLDFYVRATFFWFVGALKNGGQLRPEWLQQENLARVVQQVPEEVLLDVLDRLTATPTDLRHAAEEARLDDPRVRRFEFNPLQARPVVQLPDGGRLAPQPLFILRKASVSGVYYQAIEELGEEFARDLGDVFQSYVGDQLRLLPDVVVYDEVEFDGQRSVDFFVVSAATLVLVEVKSTRLTARSRAGLPGLEANVRRGLGKAFRQVAKSHQLLRDAHPAFADIPRRSNVGALVVTLEPYFVAHTVDFRRLAGTDPGVPTVVAATHEVEHLASVGQQRQVGPIIDRMYAMREEEPGVWPQLGKLLEDEPHGRNPLLDEAWNRYAWRDD